VATASQPSRPPLQPTSPATKTPALPIPRPHSVCHPRPPDPAPGPTPPTPHQIVTTTPLSYSGRTGALNTRASPKSAILTHPTGSRPSPVTSTLEGWRGGGGAVGLQGPGAAGGEAGRASGAHARRQARTARRGLGVALRSATLAFLAPAAAALPAPTQTRHLEVPVDDPVLVHERQPVQQLPQHALHGVGVHGGWRGGGVQEGFRGGDARPGFPTSRAGSGGCRTALPPHSLRPARFSSRRPPPPARHPSLPTMPHRRAGRGGARSSRTDHAPHSQTRARSTRPAG
jgi:hypothetical protein